MQLKTILVPCDFSDHANVALSWALGLAERWQAKVILFHAVPLFAPVGYPEATVMLDLPKMETELMADAKKRLQDMVTAQGKTTVAIETQVVMGDATWEITKKAEEDHADLIVMGSHGRTGLAHVFLGSVAERVVRHAACPVLVARTAQATTKK